MSDSEVMFAMWLSASKCNKCRFFDRKTIECVEPIHKKSKKSTCNRKNNYIKFRLAKNVNTNRYVNKK